MQKIYVNEFNKESIQFSYRACPLFVSFVVHCRISRFFLFLLSCLRLSHPFTSLLSIYVVVIRSRQNYSFLILKLSYKRNGVIWNFDFRHSILFVFDFTANKWDEAKFSISSGHFVLFVVFFWKTWPFNFCLTNCSDNVWNKHHVVFNVFWISISFVTLMHREPKTWLPYYYFCTNKCDFVIYTWLKAVWNTTILGGREHKFR